MFSCYQPAFFPSTQQSSMISGARYKGDPFSAISLDLMVGYLDEVKEAGKEKRWYKKGDGNMRMC